MNRLILIRHSETQPDSTAPSGEWRLSHKGRELCRPLADKLTPYKPTILISSYEPKAAETARLTAERLGLPSQIAAGLQEHDRSNVGFMPSGERFESFIRELFARPDELVFGTETANQAHDRFAAAVTNLQAEYPGETLGIVTHGTVMTLFVAQANEVEPFAFWKELSMPCFVVLDLPDKRILEIIALT